MFEINGVVASDVIHISYKGNVLFRMEISDSEHIHIFESIGNNTNIEILHDSNYTSDCQIDISDKVNSNGRNV